ncbi:riboflavin kinase [Sorochytrium milnesiophthora]
MHDNARPDIAGPDSPQPPYPLFARGTVVKGFGRGSKQLGIPTANLPEDIATAITTSISTGIYYGWASVGPAQDRYPMVMSVGWNPYYKNEKKTAEVHIMHSFGQDFYGQELRIVVLGYIRDEKNYTSLEALIEDINTDIRVAHNSLARPAYEAYRSHAHLAASSS